MNLALQSTFRVALNVLNIGTIN